MDTQTPTSEKHFYTKLYCHPVLIEIPSHHRIVLGDILSGLLHVDLQNVCSSSSTFGFGAFNGCIWHKMNVETYWNEYDKNCNGKYFKSFSQSSVNSTISILSSTPPTAAIKLFQATFGSLVSVKYVQGGENLDGFLTALVLTPFSVAETLDNLSSLLYRLYVRKINERKTWEW